jgi:hypothetical protein
MKSVRRLILTLSIVCGVVLLLASARLPVQDDGAAAVAVGCL